MMCCNVIRKKELFEGMIETPRRATRRSTSAPVEDSDSGSAAETTAKPARPTRRRTARFVENISEEEKEEPPKTPVKTTKATTKPTTPVAEPAEKPASNGHAQPEKLSGAAAVDGWIPGRDPKIDYSGEFEFGGSFGTLGLMIGFPLLMWYMWIGATYYDGGLPKPEPGQSWSEFGQHLVDLVYTGAFPTLRAWKIYWSFFIFEGACYCLLPGVWAYGKPLPHAGGKQLKYYCSAYTSLYFSMLVAGILHYTGVFPLYTIIDEFGPLLSVAICSGFIVSFIAYFSALARGAQHRMTGYPIYDFFMGAELNPRMFGILDFKMFFEVRLPWYILFFLSCGAAARQYERYGYVSGEVMFLVMAHYLYANACSKGEELIVTTW